jgi:hypothetical protein
MSSTKIRSAAVLALRTSLPILISLVLIVPLTSIMNRVFDGT